MKKQFFLLLFIPIWGSLYAQKKIDSLAEKVIQWRHEIHQNPELSNREFKTAKMVADHLKSLGIEVETGIAHTGVVGVLEGKKAGKVIALRADMDALPVTERNNLPFKSTVRATYNGQASGVMHACGHDGHTAMLLGAAKYLAETRNFDGTAVMIFQPAEEGGGGGRAAGELAYEGPALALGPVFESETLQLQS